MATETAERTFAVDKISYRDLYERWEKGHWRATELDFSQDRQDWHETFSDFERKAAMWNYSMFFHGEDSVTDNLSPFIDAAPLEEQKYFFATQQVDEARHAVFFGRFMREVVGRGESIAASLTATHPELTWGFRKVFRRLDKMADELRKDRSRPQLAAAITLYHMVIEAGLAVPGQHFIESYLDERKLLPGFYEGMRNVSRDEQRHIGFGVKVLHDLSREDPECRDAVAALLREVLPYGIGVFIPPGWDTRYVEVFGSTIEDVYTDGMQSLEQKLRAAGLPIEELPGVPVNTELPARERSERALALARAGLIGEKLGPPSRDPELISLLFEDLQFAIDTRHAPRGGATIQWDFTDAEPWFIRVDDGNTSVQQGRADHADLTFRCRFEDWVDVAASREDARLAMLKGKIRPKGKPLAIWRSRKLFGV